jgi:subtilisin family serine protease
MISKRFPMIISAVIIIAALIFAPMATAQTSEVGARATETINQSGPITDDGSTPVASRRLIIQLESPSLAEYTATTTIARQPNGRLDLNSTEATSYINQLKAEQAAFVSNMQKAIPGSQVSYYLNEANQKVEARYQVVLNGMAVDPGNMSTAAARRVLEQLPGVKAVYLDFAHQPELYASLPLINAQAAWDNAAVGGRENGGQGVKFASMDGGVLGGKYYPAPMFDGTGFSYPVGWPEGGLGYTDNNNGKVIVSRAYFRPWDPPALGDEYAWPGVNGTSHGVHTASIAAGNEVVADYGTITETISGVAPAAWVMSYRVFYYSVTADGSFYNAEGIAALEDIVKDGADVLNNSWGGGPSSMGGEFDPLDLALLNANRAGIFLSMSAGNAGPAAGTTDHPSSDYITVAASTTSGTLASGRFSVTAPEPVPATLVNMPFMVAGFGSVLAPGGVYPFSYLPSVVANPANVLGCNPWPAGTFAGKAALISRGTCEFGVKVLNAENAGATFVIIYNNAAGGDTLINMGPGAVGSQVTIPSVSTWYSKGQAMVAWYNTYTSASQVTFDTKTYQAGNTPDVLANFSSHGPGAGMVLKPDITAPGVNILAQGFTPGATGEDRHRGYGQVSGTSMSAPHVAGAAILLRQIHPDWSNAWIKSALMSTSKYIDIYDYDMSPAQPLAMGAGRLDLTHAADPGVIMDPPSLSFGLVYTGTTETISVDVTSVATSTQTYSISLLDTSAGFPGVPELPGFSVTPDVLMLTPGETESFSVTFDPATSKGIGDNQGFVLLHSAKYDAHMPAWARAAWMADADVLIIDNDGSSSLGNSDYIGFYTNTLTELDLSYDVLDVDAEAGSVQNFLNAVDLQAYKAVLYFTGDYYYPNGTFTVPTPLTSNDLYALNEYAQSGGLVIAMGQDLASVWNSTSPANAHFTYSFTLGGRYLQDSVNNFEISPTFTISSTTYLPMQGLTLDLSENGDGAANQLYVDEIRHNITVTDSLSVDPFFTPLFYFKSDTNVDEGTTGMAHREQPSLENPGVAYAGRSVYTTFGLEGVNNDTGFTTREELLQRALNWGWDNPVASVAKSRTSTSQFSFTASLTSNIPGTSGVSYRWDFGDGTRYSTWSANSNTTHTYANPGNYNVRVEVIDSLGNHAIGTSKLPTFFFPLINK